MTVKKPLEEKYAIVFLAWGDRYLKEVHACIQDSAPIAAYDKVLVTEVGQRVESDLASLLTHIVPVEFELTGLMRKCEMLPHLPDGYSTFLFLDSDITVLMDVSLGFQRATSFHLALAPEPHYSLDHFWGFSAIMTEEGLEHAGQLQYNTGVIFFDKSAEVVAVFELWKRLAKRHRQSFQANDQPFFTLAMEMIDFNPYTLSINYNYRGSGSAISGLVRVWHHREAPPDGLNDIQRSWPPRRAWPGKIISDEVFRLVAARYGKSLFDRAVGRLRRVLVRTKAGK